MVGSIPINNSQQKILKEFIKKQEEDVGGKDRLRTAKLSVQGNTTDAPIYRFRIDDLAFNKSNGRIKAEVIEKEASLGRTLNQFDKADGFIIGEILLSIRRDENDKIRKDLQEKGQLNPGIVTADGIVINGNRRKALLNELYEETHDEKFKYLEAHILPSTITKAELWLIEAGIQLSAPQQLDYSPINNLLKLREGINAGLKTADMASRIYGIKEEDINNDLERLSLIDSYLSDFISKAGKYYLVNGLDNHFINLLNILNYLKSPRGIHRDWDPTEDDRNELKIVAFHYIRMRMPHLRIRELRDLFLVKSSWQKVRQVIEVPANLIDEERKKLLNRISPEDTLTDEELTEDDVNNNDSPVTGSEEKDIREEALWREIRTPKIKPFFEDAKEQKTIYDNSEKPLVLAKRALDNIEGIPEDSDKLKDPEMDRVLSEIITKVNVIRKAIKNSVRR